MLKKLLKKTDQLKKRLDSFRPLSTEQTKNLEQVFDIEYTFESNRIEGNTLTLNETALVISKGITVSGKSLREHLEAINHNDAIDYIKEIVAQRIELNERILKEIHSLILRGIDRKNGGKYRNTNVRITGSKHIPPDSLKLPELMQSFFRYYGKKRTGLHPILLAADMHEKLVTIHPFVDGNGRTARLIMNLILLQNGYTLANISGDGQSRIAYYNALEKAQIENNSLDFYILVANAVKKSIGDYLEMLE